MWVCSSSVGLSIRRKRNSSCGPSGQSNVIVPPTRRSTWTFVANGGHQSATRSASVSADHTSSGELGNSRSKRISPPSSVRSTVASRSLIMAPSRLDRVLLVGPCARGDGSKRPNAWTIPSGTVQARRRVREAVRCASRRGAAEHPSEPSQDPHPAGSSSAVKRPAATSPIARRARSPNAPAFARRRGCAAWSARRSLRARHQQSCTEHGGSPDRLYKHSNMYGVAGEYVPHERLQRLPVSPGFSPCRIDLGGAKAV